jgi:hypothetical protein
VTALLSIRNVIGFNARVNQSINQSMDRVSNALTAIKDAGSSSVSSVGGFFSSSAESGVSAFKGTSLGESFFKNISAIFIAVMILLGGVLYIEFGSSGAGAEPGIVQRTVNIEPNTGRDDNNTGRTLPTDVPWTVPAISMQNELREAFGTAYTEKELEKIHTKCSDSFCVMHQKSPEELERACNSITTRKMCGTKCCCGWTKYTGFEGDNDPTVVMNTAEANVADPSGRSDGAKIPGKCVAGDAKRPFDMKDANNNERDIAYYYYLGECVGGRGCMKQGAVRG